MIYFDPPKPHPRAGEIVYLRIADGSWNEAKIQWVYGQNKYFLLSIKDNRYSEGIRFEIANANDINFVGNDMLG